MSPDAHGNLSGQRLVVLGCGYVGGEFARQAAARGLRVTALTRNIASAERLRAAGVEVVVADLAGEEWHARIPGSAEWLLNCVGSGGGGVAGYRRSYVAGMQSILAWMRRGPAGTIIYTSSTSVYPQGGGAVVDEYSPTGGAGERVPVLLEAEALLRAADCRRWFVLRLAGIYGPGRHQLLDQLRGGGREIAGNGDHRLNLIHRDDVVGAVWKAFTAPRAMAGEMFNVADEGAATKAEIAAWLADRLGVPAPRFTGETTGGRRASPPDRTISNAKIKAALGWRPQYPTYREGYASILGTV